MIDLMQQGLAAQAATVLANKEAELVEKLDKFDMSYEMSDDFSKYQKGQKQYAEIKALMAEIGKEKAYPLWNAAVDKKFAPAVRPEYYIEVNS